jgi:hypothetical protein
MTLVEGGGIFLVSSDEFSVNRHFCGSGHPAYGNSRPKYSGDRAIRSSSGMRRCCREMEAPFYY